MKFSSDEFTFFLQSLYLFFKSSDGGYAGPAQLSPELPRWMGRALVVVGQRERSVLPNLLEVVQFV